MRALVEAPGLCSTPAFPCVVEAPGFSPAKHGLIIKGALALGNN
jgi:hypothetical protein